MDHKDEHAGLVGDLRFQISVDTGGTFTDVVIGSSDGRMGVGKALTTYDRIFHGFFASLQRAASSLGIDGAEVLSAADVIVYGTTHATNAVVTGRTARTALLVTEGFADTLALREGGRRNAFDNKAAYPPPFVPRHLTFDLRERISSEGEVLTPLDEAHARAVISGLGDQAVEAVAVMLLWSIANDSHERRVGELIEEVLPGTAYTLSVDANAAIREYRRASAASIDASLKPHMKRHLGDLLTDLRGAEFPGNLMVVTSEGAVLDVDDVVDRPVLMINSGPSMAPLVGASAAPDEEVVVVCDMGGTTFDVSLVESGRVRHTREAWLGEPFVGHLTGLSSVAVQSIGAGAGSIARIDEGGLLRVGPESAGSTPGPAAYGRGGDKPTVTDAFVLLGYLNGATFDAGFSLDRAAAERAIADHVATPLGMDVVTAAQAILDVSANHMATAVRQATLEHGVDPRGGLIVAGGGAGPMVAASLGDLLDASRVLIPATAGVLAAYGAHHAPIATNFLVPLYADTDQFDEEAIDAALADLVTKAAGFADRFETSGAAAATTFFMDARYPGQAWDLRVYFADRPRTTAEGRSAIIDAFHREHDHRNGTHDPRSNVEILSWGARVEIREADRQKATLPPSGRTGAPQPDQVVFGGAAASTPRYPGGSLRSGQVINGPAIVDELTTTVVIPPGWQAELDDQRSFHLTRLEGIR